ncbi:hypothetical protein LSAT2_022517 [Lamellibrachia satsuma]|nr:hypothetical protein LSAT2_022517 [Lamellibrachia satsuma]
MAGLVIDSNPLTTRWVVIKSLVIDSSPSTTRWIVIKGLVIDSSPSTTRWVVIKGLVIDSSPSTTSIRSRSLELFRKRKIEKSEQLRTDMQSTNYEEIEKEKFIFVDFPSPAMHTGHETGDVSDSKVPSDHCIVNHINKMVDEGITNVTEMKSRVKTYVKCVQWCGSVPFWCEWEHCRVRRGLTVVERRVVPCRQFPSGVSGSTAE